MTDMRRMQGVLTEEQSRQISELKRSEDKEAEDKNRANLLTVNNSTPFSKSSSVPGTCWVLGLARDESFPMIVC